MTFARSVEPILPVEISITRMAAMTGAEQKKRAEGEARTDNRAMGRKHIVPYGLYVAHVDGAFRELDDRGLGNLVPARKVADTRIESDCEGLPAGVEIRELL